MARPPREVLFSFGQGWCSADASAMDCCIPVPAIRRSYLCPCRGGIPSYTRNGLPSNRITGPISNILCASDRYLRFAGTAQRPARLDVKCCSPDAMAMDCWIPVPAIRRSYLCPCRGGIPSYTRNGLPSNRITGPISNILCASDRYLRFAGTAQRPARLDVRCCSPDAMAMGCWISVPAIRR